MRQENTPENKLSYLRNTKSEIDDFLVSMRNMHPVFWFGRNFRNLELQSNISHINVIEAEKRFERFAPLLAQLFPELSKSNGKIESELLHVPRMQARLGLNQSSGTLYIKADHALPIAGSIKARGGFHEVLEYVENCAIQNNLLLGCDYRILATERCRKVLSKYEIIVGSTGNLGFAIGMLGVKLGLRVVVHMSADAKEWKKQKLRENGVCIIEHRGDYEAAVAAGRIESKKKPFCYFIDDEKSHSLFVGYAAAARYLSKQLKDAGVAVDKITLYLCIYLVVLEVPLEVLLLDCNIYTVTTYIVFCGTCSVALLFASNAR